MAAIFGFRIFSTDVTQAYLQSSETLKREVFIKPPNEFGLQPNQLLQLLKPLYGLPDSGDYWAKTINNHLINDRGMHPSVGDPALFYRHTDAQLHGLCATYVDDMLQAGDDLFQKETQKTGQKFEYRDLEPDNVVFAGLSISSIENTEYTIHQKNYCTTMKEVLGNCQFSDYRSLRARLAWATLCRPDIACAVAKAAQITESQFQEDANSHITSINAIVKHIHSNPDIILRFPRLDLGSLRIQEYTDAAFGNNFNSSSQLGYIMFLADCRNRCQPISWSSYKSKRVTRSVLRSEVMSFAEGFDVAYSLKHDLENILLKQIPLVMLTDSLSLFDVTTKSTITKEKRLMIDLQCINNAYKN